MFSLALFSTLKLLPASGVVSQVPYLIIMDGVRK